MEVFNMTIARGTRPSRLFHPNRILHAVGAGAPAYGAAIVSYGGGVTRT